MYVDCVAYEVRRREVGEGDISWEWGELDCILLYMICFGDELRIWVEWICWVVVGALGVFGCVGMFGGSEVLESSLVH